MKRTLILLIMVAVSVVWLSSSVTAQQSGTVGKGGSLMLKYNVNGVILGPITLDQKRFHRYDHGQFKPGATIKISGTGRNNHKVTRVYSDGSTNGETIITVSITYNYKTSSGAVKTKRIDGGLIKVTAGGSKAYSISVSIPANTYLVRLEASNRSRSGDYVLFSATLKPSVSTGDPHVAPDNQLSAGVRSGNTGQVTSRGKGLPNARVIIGTGFNYRGPSEVAVHELKYKTKILDLKTDAEGLFTAKLPPGKYDIFIWKECYVPKIYRNFTLPGPFINTSLGRGEFVLGSHCPRLRIKHIR